MLQNSYDAKMIKQKYTDFTYFFLHKAVDLIFAVRIGYTKCVNNLFNISHLIFRKTRIGRYFGG